MSKDNFVVSGPKLINFFFNAEGTVVYNAVHSLSIY